MQTRVTRAARPTEQGGTVAGLLQLRRNHGVVEVGAARRRQSRVFLVHMDRQPPGQLD